MTVMLYSESDSESSNPDSNVTLDKVEDEIVVGGRNHREAPKATGERLSSEDHANRPTEDISEESADSHYLKPIRRSHGCPGASCVLLGTWRDSSVPNNEKKHAVVGFIDVRDRLQTRIQPNTKRGESLAEDYPLPHGAGEGWVPFQRVIFLDHLVGLNHFQVKEYIRLRSQVKPEEPEDVRVATEHAAVQEAIRCVKENPALENAAQLPTVAYGVCIPGMLQGPNHPDLEHWCVRGGLEVGNPAPPEIVLGRATIPTVQQSSSGHETRFLINPLPGTRPTHILIGHWKQSSEIDPKDRHAVYGVLSRNDIFRVKLARQTRDGRVVNGNFPHGTGGHWIFYEEVEFEPHLKALRRQEVKEYCRIRQYQLEHGETSAERIENETKAVYEAQIRASTLPYKQPSKVTAPAFTASPQGDGNKPGNRGGGFGSHELPQLRQTEPQTIHASRSLSEAERHPSGLQGAKAMENTRALAQARRDVARAEATQTCVNSHAIRREGAAVGAAAASSMSLGLQHNTNSRRLSDRSEDMQRLNKVWARQETFPTKCSTNDVMMYGDITYERKAVGPFMGNLVSRGKIVSVDGDDYVEYRVLTKPSFLWN